MSDDELITIKRILMDILEIESNDYDKYEVNRETNLKNKIGENQIGLSSFDYVRFIVEIEERFNVFYDFDKEFATIGDLIDYIHRYKKWRKIDE